MSESLLSELQLVSLQSDLPHLGLIVGDLGTVVFVYDGGAAYEVEFVTADGASLAVETIPADRVGPLSGREILH